MGDTASNEDERSVQTVNIVADTDPSGPPVLENLPAEPLGGNCFRLLASPGLAGGVAAGDEIALADDGSFEVLRRSGNLAVQVLADAFDEVSVQRLTARVEELGGYLDGGHDVRLRVFTVPVSAGFPAIEAVFKDFVARHPHTEWYFGNVYDPVDDVTPLKWWEP